MVLYPERQHHRHSLTFGKMTDFGEDIFIRALKIPPEHRTYQVSGVFFLFFSPILFFLYEDK